jgi:hypothetical protein
MGTISSARGRQYELDQVQAGTASAVLSNTDGALDPMNAAGPWGGYIQPYQPFRVRAQYPPTQNLLTQVQATGGDLGGWPTGPLDASQQGPDIFTNVDPSHGGIVSTGTAFQGSNVLQYSIPSGTAGTQAICYSRQPAGQPGVTYTMQMQVRNITPGTTLQVDAYIAPIAVSGASLAITRSAAVTLTGASAPGWTQVVVTATLPTNAAGISFGIETSAAAAAGCIIQIDGWQLEKGSAPTAFTVPGVWYPVYGGYVERWPSKWDKDGTYGIVSPTGVDAFALLSQRVLRDPLTEEIYSRNPRFLYTLSDPQGVTSFVDATGNNPAAPIAVSKYGPGSLVSGSQITSATAGGAYTGSTGSVVTFANPYPAQSVTAPANFISLSSAGIKGPAKTSGTWSRMIAFRYTGPVPTSSQQVTLWAWMANFGGGSNTDVIIDTNSHVSVAMLGPSGAGATFTVTTGTVTDSNWHLLIMAYNHSSGYFTISLDGVSSSWGSVSPAYENTQISSDCVGTYVDATVGNGTISNFQGDVSYIAEFPTELVGADMTAIYGAWKSSFAGDSSDQRYARILKWAGYTGITDIAPGQTRSMGAANVGGSDALSALAAVAETESGIHYVSAAGVVTFRGRGYRYNNRLPIYTFGENASAGEWPYEEVELDFDSTHLANVVEVTQEATSQVFTGVDTASQASYFPRTMTRTVNSTNALECQDAANYLVSRYHKPLTRITTLKLHPAANPALWPVCLSLELNTRIRIMRRPFGAPPIQVDAFIEHIQWDVDDQNEATVTLQASPVDPTPYGVLASFHTALNVSAAAGTSVLTLKAGADNGNPLAAQLGVGQQLVLDPGVPNTAETVTVQAVGATAPGWTTGTVTLTSNLIHAHAASAMVCEPLPTGITDPTTFDASATFDGAAFSY